MKLQDTHFSNALCNALKNTGCAVIRDVLCEQSLNEFYQCWKLFFDKPALKKRECVFDPVTQYGYFPEKMEHARSETLPDPKEMFHFSLRGTAPCQQETLSVSVFDKLYRIAESVLIGLQQGLPVDVTQDFSTPLPLSLDRFGKTLIRILHYPPLEHDVTAPLCAAHTDIDYITLLPAATSQGLQVMNTQGEWVDVNYHASDVLVIVGDMLPLCTKNYLAATPHRVLPSVNSLTHSRLAISFFVHPKPATLLAGDITAEAMFYERLAEIGLANAAY